MENKFIENKMCYYPDIKSSETLMNLIQTGPSKFQNNAQTIITKQL